MPSLLERRGALIAWTFTFIVLGAIAGVLFGPKLIRITGLSISTLPKVNAFLSGTTTLLLLVAWWAVLRKKINLHRGLIWAALGSTTLFLVSYLVQHGSFPSVHYGGSLGVVYYPVLVSHILLAAAIVPLVLLTLFRALAERFDRHRRLARWAMPLWLYVSITGVVVYLMCAPYY